MAVVHVLVIYFILYSIINASRSLILNRGPHGPPGGNLQVLGGNTEHLGNWEGMDPFGGNQQIAINSPGCSSGWRIVAALGPTSVCWCYIIRARGGSRNSSRGGGVRGWNSSRGGGGRVQVRGNFHIGLLTSKKEPNLWGGLNPLPPPPLDPSLIRSMTRGQGQ